MRKKSPYDVDVFVPTEIELFAKEVMADLDAVAAKLARFERAKFESAGDMRAFVNVPRAFMLGVISLVKHKPALAAMKKLDPKEELEALHYLEAFKPVYDKLNEVTTRLMLNLKSRKALVAMRAMRMYGIAKAIARDSGDGRDLDMAAKVEALGRHLGPRGRPRKARNE